MTGCASMLVLQPGIRIALLVTANPRRSVRVMSFALMLLVLALCSCEPKDQAGASVKDPLDEARHLAEEGKYQEALEKHVWLHDHVLERQPSYYGVRLSYALDDWVELGKKYPKALEKLKKIRDEKTSRLLAGEGNRDLFVDVEAINAHLGDTRHLRESLSHLAFGRLRRIDGNCWWHGAPVAGAFYQDAKGNGGTEYALLYHKGRWVFAGCSTYDVALAVPNDGKIGIP